MAPKKKRPAAAPAADKTAAPAARTQAVRQEEFEAERLTGKRAQSGRLPGGGPRYTYEVKWKDAADGKKYPNSFEPADCLVGWASEMKAVDDGITTDLELDFLKPVRVANAAKEAASKRKAEELAPRREQLLRKLRRLQRNFSDLKGEMRRVRRMARTRTRTRARTRERAGCHATALD